MFLGDYFHNINSKYKKFFFSGISFNSNKIVKDNIFFAIKGKTCPGETISFFFDMGFIATLIVLLYHELKYLL